jgi:transcriptional regulator EpsA
MYQRAELRSRSPSNYPPEDALAMNFLSNISATELGPLLNLVQESTTIKRHYELFNWLQNQMQRFVPHDILITAWGNFSSGQVSHDIISPLAGMRTESFDSKALLPFLKSLFGRWDEGNQTPYTIRTESGFYQEQLSPPLAQAIASMRCGVVHGIKDRRGQHDCLYVFLGPTELGEPRTRDALRFLLPYIDIALRQICLLPEQQSHHVKAEAKSPPIQPIQLIQPTPEEAPEWGLSDREAEIMHWVGLGKTNQEIGQILDISAFTVKNHLQRIFKKLNVSNRAQAVYML